MYGGLWADESTVLRLRSACADWSRSPKSTTRRFPPQVTLALSATGATREKHLHTHTACPSTAVRSRSSEKHALFHGAKRKQLTSGRAWPRFRGQSTKPAISRYSLFASGRFFGGNTTGGARYARTLGVAVFPSLFPLTSHPLGGLRMRLPRIADIFLSH